MRAFLKCIVGGSLEKVLGEVASVTTVIYFNTQIATHRHTLPQMLLYIMVTSLTFDPRPFRYLQGRHEPQLTYAPNVRKVTHSYAHSSSDLKIKLNMTYEDKWKRTLFLEQFIYTN